MCAGSEDALEIRDDIRLFQAVKAALAKPRGERKSSESLDHAVRQLVAKTIIPEGEIIDVFSAAGLKQPDISILSDQFLAEVRGLKHKNVAAELLIKLLGDEIRIRSKRNLVQSREFSEMLKKTLNAYHNRAIATQEVIEELIKLAKQMSAATQRGVDLGLNEDEIAFHDALAANDSAIEAMGKDELKVIPPSLLPKSARASPSIGLCARVPVPKSKSWSNASSESTATHPTSKTKQPKPSSPKPNSSAPSGQLNCMPLIARDTLSAAR